MNNWTCTYQKYITAEIDKHFMCESAFFGHPVLVLVHGLLHRPRHVQGHPWLHPRHWILLTYPIHITPPCVYKADSNPKPDQNTGHESRSGAWSGPNLSMFTVKKMATSPIYFLPRVSKLPIVKLFPHNRVRDKNSQLMWCLLAVSLIIAWLCL